MGKTLEQKSYFRVLLDRFGLPRLIIAGFLLMLFIMAPIVGASLPMQITNTSTASAGTPCWCWPWSP